MSKKDKATVEDLEAPVVSAPARAKPKKTIEQWGEEKGYLPHFGEPSPSQLRVWRSRQDAEVAAFPRMGAANPNYWKFAAAKALRAWPIGMEVTEKEFEDAIHDACNVTIR